MLKIMLCSILHTRMTARIPLGDGCWSFQVWGCATLSRASKTYCTFWLVLFQCFGFGNICHDGGENVNWKIYNCAGASWQEPNEGDHPDRGDKEGSQLKPSGNRCLIVLVGVSEIMSDVSDVLEKYVFLQVITKISSSWSLTFRFGPKGPNLPQKRGGGEGC